MKKRGSIYLALSGSIAIAQINGVFANPSDTISPVETVAAHLEGVMDTAAQAAANPEKAHVQMTTCRVKTTENNNPDTVYLYQEQALYESLATPYRQRLLKISSGNRPDTVVSHSYKLTNPQAAIDLCSKSESQRNISTEEIGELVCRVYIKPFMSVYIGKTQPGGCPSNFRGAVKITNSIILHDRGMDTWDRGFDAAGNQVWGAKEDAYEFRWQK